MDPMGLAPNKDGNNSEILPEVEIIVIPPQIPPGSESGFPPFGSVPVIMRALEDLSRLFNPYSPIPDTDLPELVIDKQKEAKNDSSLSADLTNSYTSSGLRYFVDWWKYNDLTGGLGGYIINGQGGHNMGGRKDIKGKHKIINANDMAGPGAGGAATSQGTLLHLLQYLNGAFGLFTDDKPKGYIRENNDTIFYRTRLPSGAYSISWEVKKK